MSTVPSDTGARALEGPIHPLKNLFAGLKTLLQSPKEEPLKVAPQSLARKELIDLLTRNLGDHALFLFPTETDTISPVSTNTREGTYAALAYVKRIAGCYFKDAADTAVEKGIFAGKPLSKPLIVLLPKSSVSDNQWITCVILPKNYRSPFGAPTDNQNNEVVFYLDSEFTHKNEGDMAQRFSPFYQILSKGAVQRVKQGMVVKELVIPPAFPNAAFYNGSRKQQVEACDSALWAAYNAMMVVLTGHAKFAESWEKPSLALTYLLRQVILNIDIKENIKEQKSSAQFSAEPTLAPLGKGDGKESKEIKEINEFKEFTETKEQPKNQSSQEVVKQNKPKEPSDSKEAKKVKESKEYKEKQDEKPIPKFIDTSPVLLSYTANIISTLLKIEGIGNLSGVLPKDTSGQFELYAYEAQLMTPQILIKDTIDYCLKRKKSAGDRRVVFLFPTTTGLCALFIQCQGFDKDVAMSLFSLLEQRGLDSSDKILIEPDLKVRTLFAKLYSKIQCVFLGANASPALYQQLKEPVEQAYALSTLNFVEISAVNPSIALFENILSLQKKGTMSEVNTQEVYSKHREQARMTFKNALDVLKNSNPGLYNRILGYMSALFKFMKLDHSRAKRYDLKGDDLETLELLLEEDARAKTAIFHNTLDINENLLNIDLASLVRMIKTQDKPEILFADLKKALQLEITKSREWVATLKAQHAELNKRWKPYFQLKAKKTGQFLYHYSLIGIGGELFPRFAKPMVEQLADSSLAIKSKQYIQTGAKKVVYCLTLSSSLSEKSYVMTGRVLCKENIPRLLKVTGMGLGLVYTYSSGVYHFVSQMGTVAFSLNVNSKLKQVEDNEDAVLSPKKPIDPSLILRASRLAIATLESTYSKDARPLLYAMNGSMGTMALASCVAPLAQPDSLIPSNEQEDETFKLSQVGYSLGESLARCISNT